MHKHLYFLPYPFMSIHTASLLSTIYKHNEDSGSLINIFLCPDRVNVCAFNPLGLKLKCYACNQTATHTVNLLPKSVNIVSSSVDDELLDNEVTRFSEEIEASTSLTQVKNLNFKGYPIGYAIVSSLVSISRSSSFGKLEVDRLKALAKTYIITVRHAENLFENNTYKKLIIFNGRFELTNAVISVAKKFEVDIKTMEVTGVSSRLIDFGLPGPFSIKAASKAIEGLWGTRSPNDKLEAEEFYINRRNGVKTNDQSFTTNQKNHFLPAVWKKDQFNIVIFGSSMDEFFSISPEWEFSFFQNQAEGVTHVFNASSTISNRKIYYRMHPNLNLLRSPDIDEEKLLNNYKGLDVILPGEAIDTYELLDNADLVITFGSTIGIESVYWGKPQLMIGKSFYMNQPGIGLISSLDDLKRFFSGLALDYTVLERHIAPRDTALKYSNYLMKRGYEDNVFSLNQPHASINGVTIGASGFNKFLIKISGFLEIFYSENAFFIYLRRFSPKLANILGKIRAVF